VALTRAEGSSNGETEVNGARLELKRDTEAYLSRKVAAVLDRSFGVGQALASVDVTLNMDQIRTTTEDVLPAATRSGLQATGVVVREREVLRDNGASPDSKVSEAGSSRSGSAQRDVEYAVGRRVEQVVSQPGSIRRIQVVAVVRKALDATQEEQLRKVIAAAAGASTDRGDAVVVQSLAGGAIQSSDALAAPSGALPEEGVVADRADAALFGKGAPSPSQLLLGGLLIAALAVLLFWAGRRHAPPQGKEPGRAPLSEAERAAALRRVRDWMREPGAAPSAGGVVGARGRNG
jgi:flagellar M-ring protein FliF